MVTNISRITSNFLPSLAVFAFAFTLAACSARAINVPQVATDVASKDCVVLVHGLWRSGFAMRSIESDLERNNFNTVVVDYPSTSHGIEELTTRFLKPSVQECIKLDADRIHFVSHSMGGILVRQYLQENELPEGSQVVMLSPPNQGSELSEKFGNEAWYRFIAGPAASSLTKQDEGIIPSLKVTEANIGIIAAQRDWSLWPESWLPTPNDGTVSVESMKLEEMSDFILVEAGHSMMRYDDEIQSQIRYFLVNGHFFKN